MNLGMAGRQDQFDNTLMGMLQHCGNLQPFLDSIFSFLARRTDFYILMKHEKAKMGFPPGVAEGMVLQAFKKFEILTRKREAEIMREEETKKVNKMAPSKPSISVTGGTKTPDSQPAEASVDELPIVVPGAGAVSHGNQEGGKGAEAGVKQGAESVGVAQPTVSVITTEEKHTSPRKDVEEYRAKQERVKAFNYTSDVYNGGEMDTYNWSQTVTEVEIKVVLPHTTAAKDVRVDIRSDRIKVEILKPEHQVILDGRLTNKVKVDDSMWNVDRETSTLCINLEKLKEIMWKSVLEGEAGIDLTKVDNTRDISEFDTEAQSAIQRVTFDHHMKMQGKPTSSEKKAHDILKKAWNAEGSPFKGTPFDPSRVQISGSW